MSRIMIGLDYASISILEGILEACDIVQASIYHKDRYRLFGAGHQIVYRAFILDPWYVPWNPGEMEMHTLRLRLLVRDFQRHIAYALIPDTLSTVTVRRDFTTMMRGYVTRIESGRTDRVQTSMNEERWNLACLTTRIVYDYYVERGFPPVEALS